MSSTAIITDDGNLGFGVSAGAGAYVFPIPYNFYNPNMEMNNILLEDGKGVSNIFFGKHKKYAMKIFIKLLLLFLTILFTGLCLGFEERLLFKAPQVFITLILIFSYLAYDSYASKKRLYVFYFLIGVIIALFVHQVNAINNQ